jgi:hypothetical protein
MLGTCFMLDSSLTYSFTLKMETTFSFESSLTFNGLNIVISQKREIFMQKKYGPLCYSLYHQFGVFSRL